MQDVPQSSFLANMTQKDVFDVLDWMKGCGWTHWNPRTTPRLALRCSSSLNWPCASSLRLGPIRFLLLRTPRRSATAANFLVRFYQIRICPNQCASPITHSLRGPSGSSTNISFRVVLAGFQHRLHSPARGSPELLSWQICTISSSSTITLMDPSVSHISFGIFATLM